ncbi:hypothetical protein ABH897_000457 [Paenibacillus sp. RC73]
MMNTQIQLLNVLLRVVQGDITRCKADIMTFCTVAYYFG